MKSTRFPRLETARLRLTPLAESDFDDYAALHADPEVTRHLLWPPRSRERAWIDLAFQNGHWHFRGYGLWALRLRGSGAFVGAAGFSNPPGWPGFELSWVLARRWWGNGYATEAARAALDHAFTTLGQERVISLIDPANAPSIRVAERLGETLQGETQMSGRTFLIYAIHRQEAFSRRNG